MKAVTLSIVGVQDPQRVKKTFDALSAVVAVDIDGSRAVVHCGNKLDSGKLVRAADKMGCTVSVLSEMQVDEGPRMAD